MSDTIAVIRDYDQSLAVAAMQSDVDTIDQLLAPSYTWLIPEGQIVTKTHYLEDIRSGRWKPELVQHDHVEVQAFSGVAIVNGQATYRWRGWRDRLMQTIEHYTSIWQNINNEWRCYNSAAANPTSIIIYHSIEEHAWIAQERKAVEDAVSDYVEGLYEGEPARISRSVQIDVIKRGFILNVQGATQMTFAELISIAQQPSNDPQVDTTRKLITVYDIQDNIATAGLTAWWGVDFLQLIKQSDGWKIANIISQVLPTKIP